MRYSVKSAKIQKGIKCLQPSKNMSGFRPCLDPLNNWGMGAPLVLASKVRICLLTPLYQGSPGQISVATQNVRININGDSVSLSGERYVAVEQLTASIPPDVVDYYSNEQLAKSAGILRCL
jgi:hypothetical protein